MSPVDKDGLLDATLKEELLRTLLTESSSFVTCIDRQHRILFINRTKSRELSQLLGKPEEDFVVPENRAAVSACIERAFETDAPAEALFDAMLADGTPHDLKARV